MEEQTTTEVVSQEAGVQETQPVETQPEAVENTEPTSTPVAAEEPETTDNSYAEWLQKKGIDPNSPEALAKVASMAQNAERAMHEKAQKASQLEKEMGTVSNQSESAALAKAEALERKLATRDFFDRNPQAREHEQAMVDWITTDPVQGELVRQGLLSLDHVYAIVASSGGNTQAIKDQAKKETLEQLAAKQRATAVGGNATSSTPSPSVTKDNVEQWWDSLGSAGRADPANRSKLDSLLS